MSQGWYCPICDIYDYEPHQQGVCLAKMPHGPKYAERDARLTEAVFKKARQTGYTQASFKALLDECAKYLIEEETWHGRLKHRLQDIGRFVRRNFMKGYRRWARQWFNINPPGSS